MKKTTKNTTLAKCFGDRVRELRQAHGMTQEKLAEYLNVHPSYPGQLERGERSPSLQTIEKLSTTFHLPPSELLSERAGEESSLWRQQCEYLLKRCTPRQLKAVHQLLSSFLKT